MVKPTEPLVETGTITTNTVVPTHKCKRHSDLPVSESLVVSTHYMGQRTIEDDAVVDVLVPFRSVEGKRMLMETMNSTGSDVFLSLSEQFLTQSSPPSCGVATLAMVMNSLRIDPGRVWRKPWRWFTEEMLVSCFPLEKSEETMGLTMEHFGLIAECNGAVAQTFYGSNVSLAEFREAIRSVFSVNQHKRLVVAFDRAVLGQTGTGHYSPVGAYHEGTDMILILDVARFKYPPYWVPVTTMWEAMRTVDPESQRSRGFFLMSAAPLRSSVQTVQGGRVETLDEAVKTFFDRSNAEVKRFASNLAHDARKRILVCPDHCETIIDCSAHEGGNDLVNALNRHALLSTLDPVGTAIASDFTAEADMRGIDFFIQSMPQHSIQLVALCMLEHKEYFDVSFSENITLGPPVNS